MTRHLIHAITPGDHFSPRTGSAIPTVVHGLASASADDAPPRWRHSVLLDQTTFRPRYDSAAVVEYRAARGPRPIERVLDAGLARLGLPRVAATRAWRPLADTLATMPPAVVLAHNAPALPPLLRGGPHAVVLYAHNDLLRTVGRSEAARRLGDVAAIVCVSEDLAARTAEQLPATLADRVHVVDNGVDTTMFFPAPVEPGRERLRIMYVGRVVEDKGPDVLLRALRALDRDDIECVVVGSGGFDAAAPLTTYERSLRDLAAAVPGPVTFQPFVDRPSLPTLLQSADVFVVPSRWREPSGLTVGEAMATGLPVVASRVGGIPEVVGDAGLLVERDDPDALATALRALVADSDLRRDYGLQARRRAEERDWSFSWRRLRAVIDRL